MISFLLVCFLLCFWATYVPKNTRDKILNEINEVKKSAIFFGCTIYRFSSAGVSIAATNGNGASDLNPSAVEIAKLLSQLDEDIKAEQGDMSTKIKEKGEDFNRILQLCSEELKISANRSGLDRFAHLIAKRTGIASLFK
jgi:hypothetical protein